MKKIKAFSNHFVKKLFVSFVLICCLSCGDSDDEVQDISGKNPIFFDGFESGDFSFEDNGAHWISGTNTNIVSNQARSGQYSLQFFYPAGGDMSEQRFALGDSYTDIWVSYDIFIPLNYYHNSQYSVKY